MSLFLLVRPHVALLLPVMPSVHPEPLVCVLLLFSLVGRN